jgi:hypothetical protein
MDINSVIADGGGGGGEWSQPHPTTEKALIFYLFLLHDRSSVADPGCLSQITDPEDKKKHRIPDPDPQHWMELRKLHGIYVLPVCAFYDGPPRGRPAVCSGQSCSTLECQQQQQN